MEYVMLLMVFVPVILMLAMIPYVTRKTESFGIAIPEDVYSTDELKAMRKSYAVTTSVFGALLMAAGLIAALLVRTQWWSVAYPAAIVLFMLGSFMIYLKFHFRMKALKAARAWQQGRFETLVVDTGFRGRKLGFSNLWFVLPLLVALGTLVMTFALYDQIPAKIPVHYDWRGRVTDWADKSYRTLLLMPVMQLYLTALFLFVNWIIFRSKQQTDAANPQRSIRQNVAFRRRWSAFNILAATALVLVFFLIQLSMIRSVDPFWLMWAPLFVAVGMLAGAIVLAFSTGQGGSRIKVENGGQDQTRAMNRVGDEHWKLGVFYFNPDDPSIWVEKRFGVGWTVNIAHPLGWASLLIILFVAGLILWLV